MDQQHLIRIARALGDPTRMGILRTIAGQQGMCCGDLTRVFPITAATVTHHLRILSEAGLVETWRDGQFIRVRALPGRLAEYAHAIRDVFPAAGRATPAPLASAERVS